MIKLILLIPTLVLCQVQKFPGKESISTSDWSHVQAINPKAQMELLQQYPRLADWHWSWRILWVKICSQRTTPLCESLLQSALSDPALVVRSEAVRRISEMTLTATQKAKWVLAFKEAYKNPANFRSDKPLYIQEQILKSLMDLGESQDTLLKMAGNQSELKDLVLSGSL